MSRPDNGRDSGLPEPGNLLLPSDTLLAAIRGHHVGAHPLARLAYRFGVLYQRIRIERVDECCCRRAELILATDAWTAVHLPVPHPAARLQNETLGVVIDRISDAQVRAYHLLMTVEPADPRVHAAWYRLAELVDGYTDLSTGLLQRRYRLPTPDDWC